MDPISDILSHLDFAGMLYFSTEFSGDWGVRVPAYENVVRFHLVLRGECHVRIEGADAPCHIRQGDFLMIPHGAQHDLLAHPDARAPELETVLGDAGYDGKGQLIYKLRDDGAQTRLLCGHFSFSPQARRNHFLQTLPPFILARELPHEAAAWLAATLNLLATEADAPAPGNSIIVHRMTEVLFVQALRLWMQQESLPQGVLKAMGDPMIARALRALHDDPASHWTVESIARNAGMSRTVFADRFHSLTGTTPLKYLTGWRLEKARKMLQSGEQSVEGAALSVGYQSTPPFSCAFSKFYGFGPGQARKQADADARTIG